MSDFAGFPDAPGPAQGVMVDEPLRGDSNETLEILVTEPTKRGEGMDAHVVYRVATKTSLPQYRYREFYCFRRFKDFDYLYQKLAASHPGVIVPPLPDKGVIDRFGPGFEKAFIEARRVELQRYMYRIANHPVLRNSPHLALFLQATDDEWNEEQKKGAQKSKGFFQMFKEAKTNLTGDKLPLEDWYEAARQHSAVLELHIARQRKLVEQLQKARSSYGQILRDAGIGFISLASGVHNQQLLTALKHVGEAAEAVGKDEIERADAECDMLEDMLADNNRFIQSMKDVMKQREKMMITHMTAQSDATAAHAEADKLRLRGDRKSLQARDEAENASKVEADAKHALDEASSLFQQELRRFDAAQATDFKRVLRRYVRSRINAHRAAAELWEAALPDVEAVTSTPGVGAEEDAE